MDTTQMNFSDFGYAAARTACGRRWHAAAAGAGGGRRVRGLERQTDGSDVAIAD